jgi:hypothetical protein
VCVVDGTGKIVRESKVASEPEALIAWFRELELNVAAVAMALCGAAPGRAFAIELQCKIMTAAQRGSEHSRRM